MIRVLFAPDWRSGDPYQGLLAEALARHGVEVHWLSYYKRGLPLARALAQFDCDLWHLHWPEAYFARHGQWSDGLRTLRYPLDLHLASLRLPMVLTAHNLLPHNRETEFFARRNATASFRRARAVFAHSEAAKYAIVREHGIAPERITTIPFGSPAPSALIGQGEAKEKLQLKNEKICLIFGTVEPYKGIEGAIALWKQHCPAVHLAIIGKPVSAEYEREIRQLADSTPNVSTRMGWLSEAELRLWISAADCTLFNYESVLTSGAAPLARSMGIPILIPSRLGTIDLMEPDPRVFRFDPETFTRQLDAAARIGASYAAAEPWRRSASWDAVARITTDVYQRVLTRTRDAVPGE